MVTIEEAEVMLDEIAQDIPEEFFRDLNGGISLLPEEKRNNELANLFTMGEYRVEPLLGRYIVIYYGSFIRLYSHLPAEIFKEKLKKTLLHEFTHHIESLAGERGLEIKDEQKMEMYRRK